MKFVRNFIAIWALLGSFQCSNVSSEAAIAESELLQPLHKTPGSKSDDPPLEAPEQVTMVPPTCLQTGANRSDIYSFNETEIQTLADLVMTYITGEVIDLHGFECIHGERGFVQWHTMYLWGLEQFLCDSGFPQYVPLPYWDPADPVPMGFEAIDPSCTGGAICDPLEDLTPNFPIPPELTLPDVCNNFNTLEQYRRGVNRVDCNDGFCGLELYHNDVHCILGGAMCVVETASSALIFWIWHAYVDLLAKEFCTQCPGVVCFPVSFPEMGDDLCSSNVMSYVEEMDYYGSLDRSTGRSFKRLASSAMRYESKGDMEKAAAVLRELESDAMEIKETHERPFDYDIMANKAHRCALVAEGGM